MSAWVGDRLADPVPYDGAGDRLLKPGDAWPTAAWGCGGDAYRADLSTWPVQYPYEDLGGFLDDSKLLWEHQDHATAADAVERALDRTEDPPTAGAPAAGAR